MTEEKKELKIEFAPGCFDSFEGTQEELNELIAEIKNMFTSGEFLEKSVPLSEEDFDDIPEEVQDKLISFFNNESNDRKLN